MEVATERVSTPIRSPSEKDSRIISVSVNRGASHVSNLASGPGLGTAYRRPVFAAPGTGALRSDTEESISHEILDEACQDVDEENGWDTDLETDEAKEDYDVTGKTAYIQACIQSKVVPASCFLRNMQASEVNFKHHGLGPLGTKALAVALVANTFVTKLNVCDTWMGYQGAGYIAEMLRENCYISDLDLSDNQLGFKGADSVYEIMEHSSNITRLSASGNDFDDKAAKIFAEALKSNNSLKYLCLSHNQFGDKAGQLLGPAIAANDTLDELDLSWNHLRSRGACVFALSLKENLMLKVLNLAWNGFGNDGALAIGEALKVNATLLVLDLTNNRITAEGAVHIAEGLADNTTLQHLKIGRNPMQSAGAYALVNSMKNNPETAIIEVELSDIRVNNDFIELCKEIVQMRGNVIITHGGSGGAALEPASRPSPMKILKNYIADNQLRLLDFFNHLDKDKSQSLSVQEFAEGLKETGIDMSTVELIKLIRSLDKNNDGEINYSELVMGSIEQSIEDRKEKLKEMESETRKRRILGTES